MSEDKDTDITQIVDDVHARVQKELDARAASTVSAPAELTSEFITQCLFSNSLGDARIYATLFRNQFIYVKNTQEWYEWLGHYWQKDLMNHSLAAVEKVALEYLKENKRLFDKLQEALKADQEDKSETSKIGKRQKAILERVRQLRGDNRRNACLKFAHTIDDSLAIAAEAFDLHPMLFPCANGVIDLETGRLHPGNPSDYLSLASPVEFKGIDEPAPIWEKALLQIFNCDRPGDDTSMVEYIQRLFGYAITGSVKEKVFPILYGKTGWNGRSMITDTISHIMGALATPIPSEMLLSQKFAKSSSGPSPDVMSLKGVRCAFAAEIDDNQRFSVAKIKWLTGKDELTARNPNATYSTRFNPTHKLIVATNTMPGAPPDDKAFWERVHLIPFDISFVKREPREAHERVADLDLDSKIMKEVSGVLAWMVKGCLLYQKHGLKPPPAVTEATANYCRNEDMLLDFIEACCVRAPGEKTQSAHLYHRFVSWFHDNHGPKEYTSTWFGKAMSKKFDKSKSEGCNVYHGIGLQDSGIV